MLDHLKIDSAHVVGLSMGGFAALHVGIAYAARALLARRGRLRLRRRARQEREIPRRVRMRPPSRFEKQGWPRSAKRYALGPTRVQFQNKDPRGWAEFAEQLAEHSTQGQALTMRGVQMRRPSLWELVEDMKKHRRAHADRHRRRGRSLPRARAADEARHRHLGLAVMPNAGHTINIEDPEAFNRLVFNFLAAVDVGSWRKRDPRSTSGGILGMARK